MCPMVSASTTQAPAEARPWSCDARTPSPPPHRLPHTVSTPSAQIDTRLGKRGGKDSQDRNLGPAETSSFITPPKPIPIRPRSQENEDIAPSNLNDDTRDASVAPEDAEFLQDDSRVRTKQSPGTRLSYLRTKLKIWEKQFESRNGGRKASKEDIRQNVKVAARYREYHRLRELITREAPALNFGAASMASLPSKSSNSDPASGLGFFTPKGKRKGIIHPIGAGVGRSQPSDKAPPVPLPQDLDEVAAKATTPASQRIAAFVGPTPQRNGHVLGIFDSLTPTKPRSAQSPPKSFQQSGVSSDLTKVPTTTLSTPKRSRADDDSNGDAAWTGRANRWQRTPTSEGKKFFMGMFVTPTKKLRLGKVESPSVSASRREGLTCSSETRSKGTNIVTTPSKTTDETTLVAATPALLQRHSVGLGIPARLKRTWSSAGLLGSLAEQEENDLADELDDYLDDEQVGPLGVSSFAGRISKVTSAAATPNAPIPTLLSTHPPEESSIEQLARAVGKSKSITDGPFLSLDQDQDVPESMREALKTSPFVTSTSQPGKRTKITKRSTSSVTRRTRLPFGAGTGGRTFSAVIQRMRETEHERREQEALEKERQAGSVDAFVWDAERDLDFAAEEEVMRELEQNEPLLGGQPLDSASLDGPMEKAVVKVSSDPYEDNSRQTEHQGNQITENQPTTGEDPFVLTMGDPEFSDRYDENLEYTEYDPDPEAPARKWKKKGQKRTTRLVRMKPAVRAGPEPSAAAAAAAAVKHIQTSKKNSMKPLSTNHSASDTVTNGAETASDDTFTGGTHSSDNHPDGQTLVENEENEDEMPTEKPSTRNPKGGRMYDPNAPSHMNYRRLHIKDRGKKGGRGGRGRFRR